MIEQSGLVDYLDALASKAGTPGGGAAAGITGAQACALMEMVCRLTRGQDKVIAPILAGADAARARFLDLASHDMEKFNDVMTAWRAPDGERQSRLQPALKAAAEVPLEMIAEAVALIDDLGQLSSIGNQNLVTDTGIAALLLEATIRSSRLNVLINLKSIDDVNFVNDANAALEDASRQLPKLEKIRVDIDSGLTAG